MNKELDLHVSARPVSSMPGSVHHLPEGTVCDQHPDRLAVKRVQGETDSFGCEYNCMCQECLDELQKYNEDRRNVEAYCDYHKGMGLDVRSMRDYDEGMAGPLYQVCAGCRDKVHEAAAREAEEHGRYDSGFDDMFDDDSEHDAQEDFREQQAYQEQTLLEDLPVAAKPVKPPVVIYKRRARVWSKP